MSERLHPPLRVRRVLAVALAIAVVAPFVALIPQAFADIWRAPALWPQDLGLRGFRYAFSDAADAGPAAANSLVVAVAATALALVVGWPAARVLGHRRRSLPVAVLLLLASPLLVPGYATGIGLTTWLIRLGLADTRTGLVLAHLVYVLPYVVLLLAPGFGPRVTELEEAARNLGAGAVRRLVLVTVPAVLPTLATAALLGFLVSWSQYGTSLAVGGGLPMLPLVLLPFVQTDPQVASALALLFLTPALAALALATRAAKSPL
ncbi:MAG: ABC transporter permease subunit [Actinomycetota bacterium]|nr:ABC transporter permease subunit [Actinomycetota bacterium]